MATVGTRVRFIREVKQMTQQELADKLGVSKAAISRLERTPERVSPARLERIAKALGVEPSELTHGLTYEEIWGTNSPFEIAMKYEKEGDVDYIVDDGDQLKINFEPLVAHNQDADIQILQYLKLLNGDGLAEAVKRIQELTEIGRYQK